LTADHPVFRSIQSHDANTPLRGVENEESAS
jgi:hypothetical protein